MWYFIGAGILVIVVWLMCRFFYKKGKRRAVYDAVSFYHVGQYYDRVWVCIHAYAGRISAFEPPSRYIVVENQQEQVLLRYEKDDIIVGVRVVLRMRTWRPPSPIGLVDEYVVPIVYEEPKFPPRR